MAVIDDSCRWPFHEGPVRVAVDVLPTAALGGLLRAGNDLTMCKYFPYRKLFVTIISFIKKR